MGIWKTQGKLSLDKGGSDALRTAELKVEWSYLLSIAHVMAIMLQAVGSAATETGDDHKGRVVTR